MMRDSRYQFSANAKASSRPLALVFIVLLIGVASAGFQQPAAPTAATPPSIKARVAAIMDATIRQSNWVLPDGTQVTTPAPPDPDSLAAIQSIGENAIPVLGEYLWSANDRESALAMRFLYAIGGGKIVPPLAKAAREYPSPGRRKLALLWLSKAPWKVAAPVFQDVIEHDRDPQARKVATDIVSSHERPE